MQRRTFLMNSLALFALSALPKLTIAQTIAVSDEVKSIKPTNWGSDLCACR